MNDALAELIKMLSPVIMVLAILAVIRITDRWL